jgi:hypothetical protein
MAASSIASLSVLAAVWRRVGGARAPAGGPLTPGEAAEDIAVG